jgi:hypothetical protein
VSKKEVERIAGLSAEEQREEIKQAGDKKKAGPGQKKKNARAVSKTKVNSSSESAGADATLLPEAAQVKGFLERLAYADELVDECAREALAVGATIDTQERAGIVAAANRIIEGAQRLLGSLGEQED